MIKYSNKGRLFLPEWQDSSPYSAAQDALRSSKPPSYKIDVLGLSRVSQNENQPDTSLTPKAKAYL